MVSSIVMHPHHPASKGLAENEVKTVKYSLSKVNCSLSIAVMQLPSDTIPELLFN